MKSWLPWLLIGLLSIIGGIVALVYPGTATLAAEQIAGWFFLMVGLFQAIAIFREEGFGPKMWALILSAASIFVGVSLLAHPLSGILSLTFLVAVLFLGAGISKMFIALPLWGSRFFWPVMLSGLLSAVLAIMIFSNFPKSAAVVLGILLAVELISNGVTLIALALLRKAKATA